MPVLKFDEVPYEIVREGLKRKIIHENNLMTVLLDFSDGPWEEKEPPHSHPHEQTSYIAKGEVIFYCEGEEDQHLKEGDMFVVPSGKMHTIKLLTKEARLVDSFTPLREDFLKYYPDSLFNKMYRYLLSIIFLFVCVISIAQKPRLIVTTDIGQDPDDEQSMVRLLHFANEFEIEGLIANADANYEHEEPIIKASIIFDMLESYAEIEDNLRKHSADYPTADDLKSKVKTGCAGNGDKIPMEEFIGEGKDTEGSEWIIKVVDRPNDRPIHIAIWGGACDLAQALWKIKQERSQAEVQKFISKLRVFFIGKQDTSNQWIMDNFPDIWLVLSLDENDKWLSSYRGMFWGGDMSTTSKEWLHANIIDVSPLGAHYPDKAHTGGKSRNPHMAMKEGDTPSLLFFMENGLNQPEYPEWGGWGGRYQLLKNQLYVDSEDEYYDQPGELIQSPRATVFRWRSDFQNDFAARVQWGIKEFDEANHHPEVVANGERGKSPLFIAAKPGQTIKIDASKSQDPDGDSLNYDWEIYWEAGSYPNQFDYINTGKKFKLKIPEDSSGMSMHIIMKVSDQGKPALSSYKRIILQID